MLSGCANVEPVQELTCDDDACQATVFVEDAPEGATTFTLRGVVVDEAIVPVAGINVKLLLGHKELAKITTGADGTFTFNGLTENIYRLRANGPGHEMGETQVDVPRMIDDTIRMQVLTVPIPEPTWVLTKWDGMIACGYYAVIIAVDWVCPHHLVTGFERDRFRHFWPEVNAIPEAPQRIQAELYWESNQVVGDRLYMSSYASNEDRSERTYQGRGTGAAPIIMTYDNATLAEARVGIDPATGTPKGLEFHIWVDGSSIAPVGFMIDQSFSLFFSVFHHAEPEQGWAFVRDGEPW